MQPVAGDLWLLSGLLWVFVLVITIITSWVVNLICFTTFNTHIFCCGISRHPVIGDVVSILRMMRMCLCLVYQVKIFEHLLHLLKQLLCVFVSAVETHSTRNITIISTIVAIRKLLIRHWKRSLSALNYWLQKNISGLMYISQNSCRKHLKVLNCFPAGKQFLAPMLLLSPWDSFSSRFIIQLIHNFFFQIRLLSELK